MSIKEITLPDLKTAAAEEAGRKMSGSQSRPSAKRRIFFWLKIGISLLLLAYVIWQAGLNSEGGREKLLLTLGNVDLLFFALSVCTGVVMTTVSSWKWQVLLRSRGIQVPLSRLVVFYFIGRFFNFFLPSSVGGDVVRVWELGRHSGRKYDALASVFVERLSGMVTLAFISIAAVLLEPHRYNDLWVLNISLLFLSTVILIIVWLVLDRRILPLLSRLLSKRFTPAVLLLSKLERVQQAIREYKDDPVTLLQVFAISCLFYFLAVINVWVTALAFLPEVTFSSMLLAVPAIMLVMNLPISIGGIGLMEAAFALLFPLFGYTAALALSTALLMRFKTILYGIAGGFLHLARLRAQPAQIQQDD